MHVFHVVSGVWEDAVGRIMGRGYSGFPPHTNDVDSESLHNLGPLPRGLYKMTELIPKSSHGPDAIRLEPLPETEMFSRDGMLIHGERALPPPGEASNGCIILPHEVRLEIWNSGDHLLEVTS